LLLISDKSEDYCDGLEVWVFPEMNGSLIGQRRSFDGHLCTIRYVGSVQGTAGDWLGVEWDDATRGKHAGEHKGIRYFTCKFPTYSRLRVL